MSDGPARKGQSIGHVIPVRCQGGPYAGTELAMHTLAADPAVPELVPVSAEGGVYRLVGGRYVWEPGGTASTPARAPVAPAAPSRRAGGPSPAARAALIKLGADPDAPAARRTA